MRAVLGVKTGVNLPRWGLKRSSTALLSPSTASCKFTPLGFETLLSSEKEWKEYASVNLPRWGLKLFFDILLFYPAFKCKFTPLGFETKLLLNCYAVIKSVNLPRWGLKLSLYSGSVCMIVV